MRNTPLPLNRHYDLIDGIHSLNGGQMTLRNFCKKVSQDYCKPRSAFACKEV